MKTGIWSGALTPLGLQVPVEHIIARTLHLSAGRAGIFKSTDGAQSGVVGSLTNALSVEKNRMAKIHVDPEGIIGEIKTQSSCGG